MGISSSGAVFLLFLLSISLFETTQGTTPEYMYYCGSVDGQPEPPALPDDSAVTKLVVCTWKNTFKINFNYTF